MKAYIKAIATYLPKKILTKPMIIALNTENAWYRCFSSLTVLSIECSLIGRWKHKEVKAIAHL